MTHVNAFSVSNDIGRISSAALRAIAHVTTMRAPAHVTAMRTGIELLSNVDSPVPLASHRWLMPLALRAILAPYDV